jgi:hypothetical protein
MPPNLEEEAMFDWIADHWWWLVGPWLAVTLIVRFVLWIVRKPSWKDYENNDRDQGGIGGGFGGGF